jgi:hypothetical protein
MLFREKKMPQLSLALFICTDPVTEEEKLNRVVVGTPESTEEKKQPLKITEKLIRFVDSKLHLKSTAHINVSSRLLRACTTRTRWALREREQSNNNYIKALIYIGEKLVHTSLYINKIKKSKQ